MDRASYSQLLLFGPKNNFFLTKLSLKTIVSTSKIFFRSKIEFFSRFEKKWKFDFFNQHFPVFWTLFRPTSFFRKITYEWSWREIIRKLFSERMNFSRVQKIQKCGLKKSNFHFCQNDWKIQFLTKKIF